MVQPEQNKISHGGGPGLVMLGLDAGIHRESLSLKSTDCLVKPSYDNGWIVASGDWCRCAANA
jgi:hypothetical protein